MKEDIETIVKNVLTQKCLDTDRFTELYQTFQEVQKTLFSKNYNQQDHFHILCTKSVLL